MGTEKKSGNGCGVGELEPGDISYYCGQRVVIHGIGITRIFLRNPETDEIFSVKKSQHLIKHLLQNRVGGASA